jgi:hypothetical protein
VVARHSGAPRRGEPGISRFSGAQLRTIARCFASPRNDVDGIFESSAGRHLVPTFRSSCSIVSYPPSRTSESNGLLTNLFDPVPLYRSEVPERTRCLHYRDFRSAVLAADFRAQFIDQPETLFGIYVSEGRFVTGRAKITATALAMFHTMDATVMILMWSVGTAVIFVGLAGAFGHTMLGWVAPRFNAPP